MKFNRELIAKIFKQRFIKFCISGGINAVISYAIYSILLLTGFNYLVATTISFIIGVIFSYTVNALFIFHKKLNFFKLLKYGMTYVVSYFINMGLMYVFVDLIKINQFIAPITCMAIMSFVNYFLVKYFAIK